MTTFARLVAFSFGTFMILSSIESIGSRSRGASSYWSETSFQALILRQQGRQTLGLGGLGVAASLAGLKLGKDDE